MQDDQYTVEVVANCLIARGAALSFTSASLYGVTGKLIWDGDYAGATPEALQYKAETVKRVHNLLETAKLADIRS